VVSAGLQWFCLLPVIEMLAVRKVRAMPTLPARLERLARPAMSAFMGVFVVVILMTAPPAQAGRSCEAKPPAVATVQRALDLAERSAKALDATGADVVVLARAGQDLSRHGLRWSHLGWAYRESAAQPGTASVWRVVHKLNHCGTDRGHLYRQGLAEFFLDDPHEYRAGIAVLAPEVQARLWPLLRDKDRVAQLQQPRYSMLAYPWAQTYQQSNQWAIETLAMAQAPGVNSRDGAQAWLRWNGYTPTVLKLDTMTRLGSRLTAANIAFDDHPNAQRYGGRIATVTVDSVFDWLERARLAGPVQVVW